MANYHGFTRTNYFTVTDEDKFRQIMSNCVCDENPIEVFDCIETNGNKVFGFGCYGSILGLPDMTDDEEFEEDGDYDYSFDALCEALQEVIDKDDAVIITEVGYEKLRYLVGISTIITHAKIEMVSLHDSALNAAREMLNNPNYSTELG